MENVVPIGVKRTTNWLEVPVSSAWGGAGELVANATDSTSATLRNIGAWPFEFRVGAGAWTRLELRNSIQLDVSLASTQIRLRKSEFGGDSIAQLEIKSLTAEYVADGRAVQLGSGSGAASFTDLIDVPSTIVPLATLRGDASGEGIEFVAPTAPYPISAALFEPNRHLRANSLDCTDSPYLSFSYWIRLRNANDWEAIWESDPLGNALTYTYCEGGILKIAVANAELNNNFSVNSDEPITQNVWHHILGSIKANEEYGEMIAVIYIDGQRAAFTPEYQCDFIPAIPINGYPFHIGGNSPDMDLADFWFAVGQNLLVDGDIPEATRRKFTDSAGWPVNLGANGELPTGTSPTMFFHREAGFTGMPGFSINRGTGGTMDGTTAYPLIASSSPTDPAAPFENPMYAQNDMIHGGTTGTPLRLAGPSSTGTFALQCINGVLTWVAVP